MKVTPFHEKHVELGAKMVEFAGYDMPIQYDSILNEHEHVRNKVGIFDVSHMGEILVKGQEATVFLEYLMTNRIENMENGSCLYTMMCYENGNVVDDLLVYKYSETHYLLVVNASNDLKDFVWIENHVGEYQVEVTHVSDMYAELAIQGPLSEKVLSEIVGDDIKSLKFFHFYETVCQGIPMIISRTGYTGEDGFEVFTETSKGPEFLELLMKQSEDIKMIGLGARDTLRFEVALPLYGHEISDQINPIEARLSYFVDLNKEFIGKVRLEETKEDSNRRVLVGFMLKDKGIAREGASILVDGQIIGFVTTGYKLKGYEGAIGLGLIPKKYAALGSTINIQIRTKILEAMIIKRKFYDKKYKKK